jgi:hypothetical protein
VIEDAAMKIAKAIDPYTELIAGAVPFAVLASLAGIVRTMQAGRCGLKAVCVAATSAGFTGMLVHLLLDAASLPMSYKAALVGVSGYASGELLKIFTVRICKWADKYTPIVPN